MSSRQQERGRAQIRMTSEQSAALRPSYVNLSCAVSGYSPFTRYTSPDGRKRTPPELIPVATPPQTLDSVKLVLRQQQRANMRNQSSPAGVDVTDRAYFSHSGSTHTRQFQTSTTMTTLRSTTSSSYFSGSSREVSPLSDVSSASSNGHSNNNNNNNNGNLVQKQIERLYGNKSEKTSDNGFFSKRFGLTKPKSEEKKESTLRNGNNNGPLDFEPLKVPAVFRLLRPEFRDMLKSHSCQIPSDKTAPNAQERIVPIKLERDEEKVKAKPAIPSETVKVVKEKPALPTKPKSPTNECKKIPVTPPKKPERSPEKSKVKLESPEEKVSEIREERAELVPKVVEEIEEISTVENNGHLSEDCDYVQDDDEMLVYDDPMRTHLTTIMEEDNESTASAGSQINLVKDVQDGHYFIRLLENEIFKFEEQICDFEEDLATSDQTNMSDDVRDSILAAVGKAKLLMAQKLGQFRGLCDKNINLSVKEDPFVPTSQDLLGFWEMVYIQVEHIHALFAELRQIKSNGWKRPESIPPSNGISPLRPDPKKTTPKTRKSLPSPKKTPSPAKSEAAKARDEARKKMLEEKKRMMKIKKEEQEAQNGDQMFVQF